MQMWLILVGERFTAHFVTLMTPWGGWAQGPGAVMKSDVLVVGWVGALGDKSGDNISHGK